MEENNSFPKEEASAKQFNILDLPEYDYLYKQESVVFDSNFNFSITSEPKFSSGSTLSPTAVATDTDMFFQGDIELSLPQTKTQKDKEMAMEYFGPGLGRQLPKELSFTQFKPEARPACHAKEPKFGPFKAKSAREHSDVQNPYNYYSVYAQENEQAVFVNANQYQYIKKRKARRDYLDSLERKSNAAYQHESRHKHAMKRPRAPTGRFLTKEEAKLGDLKPAKQQQKQQ